jgi:hypothetical protein
MDVDETRHLSDAVLNHKLGADEQETFLATMVDEQNRTEDVGEMHNITAWTKWVGFPFLWHIFSPLTM